MIEARIDEAALTALERRRARAEAETYAGMLEYAERRAVECGEADSAMAVLVERSMIALEIGQAMGLSEGQVRSRIACARRVRDDAPATWASFQLGHIDAARMREISSAIDKLTQPESVALLDSRVVAYACAHTVAELWVWLRRFVTRVEAEAATERAEAARADRYVHIEHTDDGMAWLNAYLPSPQAAAIERRLHKESRQQPSDGRTLRQKEADLLASWATSNEAGEPAANADIAVTVPVDVLAGAMVGFAESPDGAWVAPASWITELAASGNPVWHRIVVDPVTDDVLTHEYLGRFAPKTVRKALEFRDGVCVTPGCLTPAWKCDIDHDEPWPAGPTIGTNLTPRDRRHHAQKGHGLSPPRPPRPPLEIRTDPLPIEYAPAA